MVPWPESRLDPALGAAGNPLDVLCAFCTDFRESVLLLGKEAAGWRKNLKLSRLHVSPQYAAWQATSKWRKAAYRDRHWIQWCYCVWILQWIRLVWFVQEYVYNVFCIMKATSRVVYKCEGCFTFWKTRKFYNVRDTNSAVLCESHTTHCVGLLLRMFHVFQFGITYKWWDTSCLVKCETHCTHCALCKDVSHVAMGIISMWIWAKIGNETGKRFENHSSHCHVFSEFIQFISTGRFSTSAWHSITKSYRFLFVYVVAG